MLACFGFVLVLCVWLAASIWLVAVWFVDLVFVFLTGGLALLVLRILCFLVVLFVFCWLLTVVLLFVVCDCGCWVALLKCWFEYLVFVVWLYSVGFACFVVLWFCFWFVFAGLMCFDWFVSCLCALVCCLCW